MLRALREVLENSARKRRIKNYKVDHRTITSARADRRRFHESEKRQLQRLPCNVFSDKAKGRIRIASLASQAL